MFNRCPCPRLCRISIPEYSLISRERIRRCRDGIGRIGLKNDVMKRFEVDENGFYGRFGGAYVPDKLRPCIEELQNAYLRIMDTEGFKRDYDRLLRHYVGRPSPLYLAERLSDKYGCRIYLKREDLNHTGAHKINNAIGQALIARSMGKRRIIAETGAGQHGVATATVCALMGMECRVYMGRVDVERQQANVRKMEMLGAEVVAVDSGGATLKGAVDAAVDAWCDAPSDSYYLIGSAVGPHPYPDMVARLQSVISEEITRQLMESEGRDYPDYLIACIGGGSNASGTIYHYLDREETRIVLAEAGGMGAGSGRSAATLTVGREGLLHGSRTLVMQDDSGNVIEPYSISAGLDYPGIGPLFAHIAEQGRAVTYAVTDDEALRAAMELTRLEGIIPALESSHALAVLGKVPFGRENVVVLTVSGRGDKDMDTYIKSLPSGESSEGTHNCM